MCLFICRSVWLFVRSSVCLFLDLCVSSFVCLLVCLLCLFVCLLCGLLYIDIQCVQVLL